MEFQAVLAAVRALPMEEQLRLVDQIQDDLLGAESEVTPELMHELDRRIAAMETHPDGRVPSQQAPTAARARHKR